MRPLHLLALAAASVVPVHAGHPHLVTDSVLGVAVGVVVVGLYVLALRWTGGGRGDRRTDGSGSGRTEGSDGGRAGRESSR
ncbi:hypothetical protein [Halosimplex halophilum]|uniref:hypothetical protein n=1 Tax=Halosimplex halophilum TaxID=2559572 RepID=UPI00107F17C7|nr:hypothetical protein [Halosimplex halophilum]